MASLTIAPRSISAPTRDELTRAVLAYQRRRGAMVHIISVIQDMKTKEWVAWFVDDVSNDPPQLNRRLRGDSNTRDT